ncbi:MAG: hypothetical protein HYY32_06355 [Chloroflexi bacterium]|nr:hypothetical protein [Chloroflexota bacterium]
MTTRTITVLDPTGNPTVKGGAIAHRLPDLNGKVVGFLWNSKPNADLLLLRIREQLSKRFHFAGTNWYQKPLASIPARASVNQDLMHAADHLVINAVGD